LADPEYPQRKAIEVAPVGSVLVMDCRGIADTGVIGDILATRLEVRAVAGVVADGCVRDADELKTMALPVFCLGGAAPSSITSHYAADIQLPIACGGVAVIPGDIIVGDGDGVVVIPRAKAVEIAKAAAHREDVAGFVKDRIADGAALPGNYPPSPQTMQAFEAANVNKTIDDNR
jgi:regulator of RNase E activity RraA